MSSLILQTLKLWMVTTYPWMQLCEDEIKQSLKSLSIVLVGRNQNRMAFITFPIHCGTAAIFIRTLVGSLADISAVDINASREKYFLYSLNMYE